MAYQFPVEIERLIHEKMASGDYRSEDDVLLRALQALNEMELRHQELQREIRSRLNSTNRDQSSPLDRDAFKAEARSRFAQFD